MTLRNYKLFYLVVINLLFFVSSGCAEEKDYPIDKYIRECTGINSTTPGMVGCIGTGVKKWESEIDKYYNLVSKKLSKEEKEKFETSQSKWRAYVESEHTGLRAVYGRLMGTIYITDHAFEIMNLYKDRALRLKKYYEILQENRRFGE